VLLTRRPFAVLRREDGSFIVVGAIAMLVFALLGVTVIHFGDLALHRRHLQLQTDAAALAGGQAFSKCLVDPANALAAMTTLAGQYGGFGGGTSYNQQLANGTPSAGTVAPPNYNRVAYPSPSTHADDSDSGLLADNVDPCTSSLFDVKATESNVKLLGAFPSTVNAHSAVQIRIVAGMSGMLPLAVPDVRFNYAFATFIDEATGAPACTAPCSVALTKGGIDAQGHQIWTSASTLPVTITRDVGVRIRLVAGNDSTLACGVQFTECFTDPATTPNQGLVHIRGWQSTTSTAVQAYNVTMAAGTCAPDGYFVVANCSAGIDAELDFGDRPLTGAGITATAKATIDGIDVPLTRGALVSGTTYLWSANGLPITGAGAHPITLSYSWEQTTGTWRTQLCKSNGSNPCKENNQPIENGAVQRPVEGSMSSAGPIKLAQIGEGASTSGANSFQIGSVHSLSVTIATSGTLQTQAAATDPLVDLKVINDVSASQEQALDCDPGANFHDEVVDGCAAQYIINGSSTLACPTANQLWNTAQPWECVKTQTGNFVGPLKQALEDRILGGSNKPCSVAPIHWPYDETLYPKDPRVVPLIITPFGTFQRSGNDIFPVIDIGAFYIMGWESDPCLAAGQTVDKGSVIGHFIHYIPSTNTIPSGRKCALTDPNQVTPCMPVLIR
jgi:hypothetical protein